jgi:adenylate cyclase class 2
MNIFLILFVALIVVAYLLYSFGSLGSLGSGAKEPSKHVEYEYAFLFPEDEWDGTGVAKLQTKLQKLGGKKISETVMPITVYYLSDTDPHNKLSPYIRVRDEGNRTTFTFKTDLDKQFVTEHEVNIEKPGSNAANEMHKILLGLKLSIKYRVEKLREIWHYNVDGENVEVVFDTYPGLPTYIEIEAKSKELLDKATKKLGFNPDKALDSSMDVYSRIYGMPKDRKPILGAELTFSENAKQQFVGLFTKNEELFDKLLKKQIKHVKNL